MFARGVASTSIDDVLGASSTSKSQVYHYFDDKQDLVRAVVELQTERVLASQQPHLARLDSMAALRAWGDALIALQRNGGNLGGCPLGSMAAELADSSEAARVALAGSFQRWQSYLTLGLQAMRDSGELRPNTDPDALALSVMTAVQGGLLLTKTTRDSQPLELALDMALAHVASHRRPVRRARTEKT